jgi:hypothetical protein
MRRARWIVIALVLALIAASAALHLRLLPVTPVYAILWPLGDVPEGETAKTLYVESGTAASYATVPIMGRGTLTANTSGWYAYLAKGESVPPAGAAVTLPAAGDSVSVPLSDGSTLRLYNYNGSHGAAVRASGTAVQAWAAEIIQTSGGVYVWHPAVPDQALRDFIASRAGGPAYLFVPSTDYVTFDGSSYIMYCDYWDGAAWTLKTSCYSQGAAAFAELAANTPYSVDGLERVSLPDGALAYAHWPALAYFYNASVTQSFTTSLRAETG